MTIFQGNGMISDVHLEETSKYNSKEVLIFRHSYHNDNKKQDFERVLVFNQLIINSEQEKEKKYDTKVKERFTSMVMLLIDMVMHQDKEIKGVVAVMKKF